MTRWHWVTFAALAWIARDFCACFSLAVPAGRHDVSLRAAARGRGATVVEALQAHLGTRSLAYGRGCGQRRTGSSAAGKVARTAGSAAAMASSWSLHLCIFASSGASSIGRSTRRDGLRRDDELRRDLQRDGVRCDLISSSSSDSKQAQSLCLDARRDRGDAIDLMPTWGLTSVGARETKDVGNCVQNGVEGC